MVSPHWGTLGRGGAQQHRLLPQTVRQSGVCPLHRTPNTLSSGGLAGMPLPEHQLATLGPSIRATYIYRLQTESRVIHEDAELSQGSVKTRDRQVSSLPGRAQVELIVIHFFFCFVLFFSPLDCLCFFGTTYIRFLAPHQLCLMTTCTQWGTRCSLPPPPLSHTAFPAQQVSTRLLLLLWWRDVIHCLSGQCWVLLWALKGVTLAGNKLTLALYPKLPTGVGKGMQDIQIPMQRWEPPAVVGHYIQLL